MKYLDALATFWQRNAEIRHGHLPRTGDVQVPQPAPQPATTQPAAQPPSLASRAAPYIAALALGGGAGVGVPLVLDALKGDEPPAVVDEQEQSGSLYQYLEDRNDHISP
jgi:hypothetical protein